MISAHYRTFSSAIPYNDENVHIEVNIQLFSPHNITELPVPTLEKQCYPITDISMFVLNLFRDPTNLRGMSTFVSSVLDRPWSSCLNFIICSWDNTKNKCVCLSIYVGF